MERQQTGQKEQLVEVKMDGLEVPPQPGASSANRHVCLKGMVALATVMGLILAVILHIIFIPSCNQVAPPLSRATITCTLKKTAERGTYDIFTANESGTYLIYGWVELTAITNDVIVLAQREPIDQGGNERSIQDQCGNKRDVFFYTKVILSENHTLILKHMPAYTSTLFLVHKL